MALELGTAFDEDGVVGPEIEIAILVEAVHDVLIATLEMLGESVVFWVVFD